jgi:hypothetical protein
MSNFDPKTNSYIPQVNDGDNEEPIEVGAVTSVYTDAAYDQHNITPRNPVVGDLDSYATGPQSDQSRSTPTQSSTQTRQGYVTQDVVTQVNNTPPREKPKTEKRQEPQSFNQNPRYEQKRSGAKFDYLKYLALIGIPVAVGVSLFVNNLIGLLSFWLAVLVGIKLKPNLAWVIVLIYGLSLILNFPIENYLVIAAIGLTLVSALFLGLKPNLSKFNKFATVAIALVVGLWITVPMSQLGTLKYLQQEYSSNSLFQNVVDSIYIGAGSPKLSPAEIEDSFKTQISTEIANNIKDKTKLLPAELSKVTELCKQLGADEKLNQDCATLDKDNIDKSIDSTVASQVDSQTKDLKNQFNQYPQVQMVEHFLNGLGGESKTGFWASPYFVPGIVLLMIYVFLSGLLQLISWPILLLLKRISLS